jgi:hypothetical protein
MHMLTKKFLIALTAAGLTCLSATQSLALTATTSTTTTSTTTTTASTSGVADDALVSRYTKLAGSKPNAQSLVTGLHTGSVVTLTASGGAPAVTFTPSTQHMGFGSINIALALAKTTLAKQGITNPSPTQLAAALNGGSITLTNGTVVKLAGVLAQRSAGMGWGKIAKALGVKLGAVVSASKTDKAGKKETLAKTDDDSKKDKAVKTAKTEKTEKIEKAEKTEKVDKPEKLDKKEVLAKVEDAKTRSTTTSGNGSSNGTGAGSGGASSGNNSNTNSGNASSHSGGNSSNSSSHEGGGGSSHGGGNHGGGNGGGSKK